VANAAPFHSIWELGKKLLPVAVSVNVALLAFAFDGEIDVSCGTGFATVKANAFDVPPAPGVNTLTWAMLLVAKSVAGT
jgi:hypothetical protein